jgi:UDP-N-acetylmuramoylalanine--D-glutamate ligase
VDIISLLQTNLSSNKNVLVVGLGISGVATARILSKRGFRVVAIDKMTEDDVNRRAGADSISQLKSLGVSINFGIDGEGAAPLLENVGLCVLSPGISLESAIVGAITRRNIPICNELELAVDLIGLPTIVVTGSNGKSTTVTLINEMLRASGLDAKLCGNVGIPVISLIDAESDESKGSHLVIEASSYQLETCYHLHPTVAVWLNISDNHLERHGTIDRYLDVKTKVFACQSPNEPAIVNFDDDRVSHVLRSVKGKPVGFGRSEDSLKKLCSEYAVIELDAAVNKDQISLVFAGNREIYNLDRFPLHGVHNRYDAAAALLAARKSGATVEGCQSVLNRFTGLRHRYQLVDTIGGVAFINDSKSTTVASTCAALASTREQNPKARIHLMVGGMVKAGSWMPLIHLAKGHITEANPIVCFGGDGRIIHNHLLTSGIPSKILMTHRDAFRDTVSRVTSGDIVLFSPGCASFDEFQNFEKRGDAFEKLVREHGGHNRERAGMEYDATKSSTAVR